MYCHWNFPGFNKIAEFWGNASLRSARTCGERGHSLYAMRLLETPRRRDLRLGRRRLYKEKYGCWRTACPGLPSRVCFISKLRGQAKIVFETKQRFQGWWQSRRGRPSWRKRNRRSLVAANSVRGKFSTYRSRLPSNPSLDGQRVLIFPTAEVIKPTIDCRILLAAAPACGSTVAGKGIAQFLHVVTTRFCEQDQVLGGKFIFQRPLE